MGTILHSWILLVNVSTVKKVLGRTGGLNSVLAKNSLLSL